jgi:hypothetical protein
MILSQVIWIFILTLFPIMSIMLAVDGFESILFKELLIMYLSIFLISPLLLGFSYQISKKSELYIYLSNMNIILIRKQSGMDH